MHLVYSHSLDGEVFYIGKGTTIRAHNLFDRSEKYHRFVNGRYDDIKIEVIGKFKKEKDALNQEAKLISQEKPATNTHKKTIRAERILVSLSKDEKQLVEAVKRELNLSSKSEVFRFGVKELARRNGILID